MNWLTVAVLGAIAGWFEFTYQRSRRGKRAATAEQPNSASDAVRVEEPGEQPSISPGDEVDQKVGTRA